MSTSPTLAARLKPLDGALFRIVCGATGCPGWLGNALYAALLGDELDRPYTRDEATAIQLAQASGFTIVAFRERLAERGEEVSTGDWLALPPKPYGGIDADPAAFRKVSDGVYAPIGPRRVGPHDRPRRGARAMPSDLRAHEGEEATVRGHYPALPVVIECPVCRRLQRVAVPQRTVI